jgi:hypothetical protein
VSDNEEHTEINFVQTLSVVTDRIYSIKLYN